MSSKYKSTQETNSFIPFPPPYFHFECNLLIFRSTKTKIVVAPGLPLDIGTTAAAAAAAASGERVAVDLLAVSDIDSSTQAGQANPHGGIAAAAVAAAGTACVEAVIKFLVSSLLHAVSNISHFSVDGPFCVKATPLKLLKNFTVVWNNPITGRMKQVAGAEVSDPALCWRSLGACWRLCLGRFAAPLV